jgi:hypothetical protein
MSVRNLQQDLLTVLDENFPGCGMTGNARSDVDRQTTVLLADLFELACVNAGTKLHIECPHAGDNCLCALNRPCRPEHGEETISSIVHFATPKASKLIAYQCMMPHESFAPRFVAGSYRLTSTGDRRDKLEQ